MPRVPMTLPGAAGRSNGRAGARYPAWARLLYER